MGLEFNSKIELCKALSIGSKFETRQLQSKKIDIGRELLNYSKTRKNEETAPKSNLLCNHCDDARKLPDDTAVFWREGDKLRIMSSKDTNVPGRHELNDTFAEGYTNEFINDEDGNRVENIIKSPNGEVVYSEKRKYYPATKDRAAQEEREMYDKNGKKTGSLRISYDQGGFVYEYRDAKGKLLMTGKNGKYYYKDKLLSPEEASRRAKSIFPKTKAYKDYMNAVIKGADKFDKAMAEIAKRKKNKI